MASLSVIELVKHIFYLRIPVVIVYIFVCGFLILISSKREMRILGIWALLVGTGNCLSNIRLLLEYLCSKNLVSQDIFRKDGYISFMNLVGLITLALYIARNIMMWLYEKRNYGTKNAPIIAIIILIICNMTSRYIISMTFRSYDQYKSMLIATSCSEAVFSIAIAAIHLVIFFKNRAIDRNIPKFWLFHLYAIITAVISLPMDLKANLDYNNDNFIFIYMLVCIMFSIFTLSFYTYAAIRAHKQETAQTWYY